jgi:CheY-like chemotaxis protein
MKTILIIDDDKAMLATLSAALGGSGYKVNEANSAHTGLASAYQEVPDLIVCDIRMPDLEGTTVLQALRVDPATEKCPIILISGVLPSEMNREKALAIGANGFLAKPFQITELLKLVAGLLA